MVLARWAKLVFWMLVCCDYRCHCRSPDGSPPDSFPQVLSSRRLLRGSVVQGASDLDRLSSLKHAPQNKSTGPVDFSMKVGNDSVAGPWSYFAAAVSRVLDGVHTTMLDLVIFIGDVFSNLTAVLTMRNADINVHRTYPAGKSYMHSDVDAETEPRQIETFSGLQMDSLSPCV